MKLCKCPICHSEISLEALIKDDAGRELLNTIVNIGGNCGRAVVSYLGLFKPQKNSLANSRALKIVQSLLELYSPSNVLEKALMDTVEQVRRNRRETGRCEPLANHNYLTGKELSQKLAEISSILQKVPNFSTFALRRLNMNCWVGFGDRLYMAVSGVFGDTFIAKIPVKGEGCDCDEFPEVAECLTEIKESEFLAIQGK